MIKLKKELESFYEKIYILIVIFLFTKMNSFDVNNYDVIIAGSGPAGSSAAHLLALEGYKVLILEKENLPRYKTCGGGLTYKGLDLLPYNLSGISRLNCYSAEINDYDAGLRFNTRREKPLVAMTMRNDLDYFLLNEAKKSGAVISEKSLVTDIKISDEKLEIKCSEKVYNTKFLIAADGALSFSAKKTFWKEQRKLIPALEYELFVEDEILSCFNKAARFDFGIIPHGYAWVFPKKDHLSVGLLTMKAEGINLNNYFNDYLNILGIKEIINSERHGFVIPISPRKFVAKGRVLLAGDAAGFVDPVTAEGISFAILSGQLAAESIIESNLNAAKVCDVYEKKISEKILPELKAAKFLAQFIYNSTPVRVFIMKLYGKRLSELITDVITGEKKYSDLVKNPLNYLKLFKHWSFKNLRRAKFQTST